MAKIISIPPPAAQAGGLSNSLVAGLVGDRVVDPFLVADNNNITGQFLRDLIGSAFDAHRTLQTMNAVAASATAMNAVAASATAVEAIRVNATANNIALGSSFSVGAYLDRIRIIGGAATDATLAAHSTMSAVVASSTAMNAVVASATAMNAVAASSTAMNAVAASLTARSAVRQSTIAINAINAVQPALDTMYTAAVKWANVTNGNWQTGTLVETGNYLVVRLTQRSRNWWGEGSTNGAHVRRGDLTGWTTTNAGSSLNLIQRENGTILDNALQTVNAQSIQFHLLEGVEIAYLTA